MPQSPPIEEPRCSKRFSRLQLVCLEWVFAPRSTPWTETHCLPWLLLDDWELRCCKYDWWQSDNISANWLISCKLWRKFPCHLFHANGNERKSAEDAVKNTLTIFSIRSYETPPIINRMGPLSLQQNAVNRPDVFWFLQTFMQNLVQNSSVFHAFP